MFIKIEQYSIPVCSILFIERVKEEPVNGGSGGLKIKFINGEVLFFRESEETKFLEKKFYEVDKDENKE